MAKVTGVGGVFIRAKDPKVLKAWYAEHLGVELNSEFNGSIFKWDDDNAPERPGQTVWGLFNPDTDYFGSRSQQVMINYRVDDLDALLAKLEAAGANIDPNRHDDENGRFAWVTDPEGNRMELWEPPTK